MDHKIQILPILKFCTVVYGKSHFPCIPVFLQDTEPWTLIYYEDENV